MPLDSKFSPQSLHRSDTVQSDTKHHYCRVNAARNPVLTSQRVDVRKATDSSILAPFRVKKWRATIRRESSEVCSRNTHSCDCSNGLASCNEIRVFPIGMVYRKKKKEEEKEGFFRPVYLRTEALALLGPDAFASASGCSRSGVWHSTTRNLERANSYQSFARATRIPCLLSEYISNARATEPHNVRSSDVG